MGLEIEFAESLPLDPPDAATNPVTGDFLSVTIAAMSDFTLASNKTGAGVVTGFDASGNAVAFTGDDVLTVASSDETIATATIAGNSVSLTPVAAGTAVVTVTDTITSSGAVVTDASNITVTEAVNPVSGVVSLAVTWSEI